MTTEEPTPREQSRFARHLAAATGQHPREPVAHLAASMWEEAERLGYDCDPNLVDLLFDQWVVAVIVCGHGRYQGTSDGFMGFTQAVGRAARKWADAHPPKTEKDPAP